MFRNVLRPYKQRCAGRFFGIHVENKVVWEKKGESGQCSEERLGGKTGSADIREFGARITSGKPNKAIHTVIQNIYTQKRDQALNIIILHVVHWYSMFLKAYNSGNALLTSFFASCLLRITNNIPVSYIWFNK